MTDLEQIDEFLENYKKVSPKKYYSEAQINEMFVKDFMDYRRSIMMNEKLSARQKAMILAGMIGAGGLTGGLTSCAQPNTEDNTNIEQEETVTMVNVTFKNTYAKDITISYDNSTFTIKAGEFSDNISFEKDKKYTLNFYASNWRKQLSIDDVTFNDDSNKSIVVTEYRDYDTDELTFKVELS